MNEVKVLWSLESSRKAEEIKEYLYQKWSEKEVKSFLNCLKRFESLVKKYPNLYKKSASKVNLRKAVISRYQSVVYEFDQSGPTIFVHTILDNRENDNGNS